MTKKEKLWKESVAALGCAPVEKTCKRGIHQYTGRTCPICQKTVHDEWKKNNPEIVRKNRNEWASINKEKVAEINRKQREKNPVALKEKKAEYRENNRTKISETGRIYRENNKEEIRALKANRRAKQLAAGGSISKNLIDRLKGLQRGRCACCNKHLGNNFHLDHIMPLALGGSNTDENMQLLRQRCNNQKGAKHPVEFMQSRGFLL